MSTFLIYLLKAGSWLVAFYLLYILVFRRFSFFKLNRAYLLCSITASFLLPIVRYSIITPKEILVAPAHYRQLQLPFTGELPGGNGSALTEPAASYSWNWMLLLFIIYLAGVVWTTFRFARHLAALYRVIQHSPKEKQGSYWLVYAPEQYAHASFFNYIFLNPGREHNPEHVHEHEQVHARRLHSLDVLLCEAVRILQWFNPFVLLYKKSLCELHEFEADAQTAGKFDKEVYAASLLQLAMPQRTALTNQFSRRPLKTRITRLFMPKTNNMKKLLFLLTVPVTVVLLFAFRNINRKTVPVWINQPITLVVDAGHGGKEPGVQANGIMEKDLTLAIAQKIKTYAEAAGIKVVMTRSDDNHPTIKERAETANAANPHLLVSVHINNALENDLQNGIECYAGANNAPQHAEQSAMAAQKILQSLSTLPEIKTQQQLQSRSTGIGILKMTSCPAILLECGYLNNNNDFRFITNNGKQEALAKQIVQGILAFAQHQAAATGKTAVNNLGAEPAALEGKIPQLYKFPENGTVLIDGKQVAINVVPDINPALIKHSVLYEPGNAVAIKKYGKTIAENGLLVLYTKTGKGEYQFIGETEKNNWLEVARAMRRINTTTKYDRFTYTGIDGKTSEVLVLAGGKAPAGQPELTRFLLGSYGGKPIGPVNFIINGLKYTEEDFVKELNKLPENSYEIVYPWPVKKTNPGDPLRVEIKKLDAKAWSLQGLVDDILPPVKKNEGC